MKAFSVVLYFYAAGASLVALRLGWHMIFKLDRYDWQYTKGNIWSTSALLAVLWPLSLVLVPRNLVDPTKMFSNRYGDAARARLRNNPPPCSSVIRYRQDEGFFEEAFGEFLFPADAVEQLLTRHLREHPHLAGDDDGAILNWLRRRDGTIREPTDVPSLWARFRFYADDLIRAGEGKVHCRKCNETFATGALIPADDEGKAHWIVNKLACPRGHKLLVVERGHVYFGGGAAAPDRPVSEGDRNDLSRPKIRYAVSSQYSPFDDEDRSAHDKNRATGMSPDEAGKQARAFLAARIRLVRVDSLPTPVYNFDPTGWHLFAISERTSSRTGGDQYVAVSKSTGEVRDLGLLG